MRCLKVSLGERSYDVVIGKGSLDLVGEVFDLNRRVLIVTDENVPLKYPIRVKKHSKEAEILTLPSGEGTKSFAQLERIHEKLIEMKMTRQDCIVAVGGGVIGDLAGFAAATYMRGIDFYNIPTTTLSQVDSSIGGKTAINLGGVKNIVGAFHQPRAVLIDTETLDTLPERHYAAGLCEAIKMAVCFNEELFKKFEEMSYENIKENIDWFIGEALSIKKKIVEMDEKEGGIRKALNFGHTIGHGIESAGALEELYHGECVAIGMLPFSSDEVRERLVAVLKKVGLPTRYSGEAQDVLHYTLHDKKSVEDGCSAIFVENVGECLTRKIGVEELAYYTSKIF